MRYKIRCYPMVPLNGGLPGPYVPVRVKRGAVVAHRYTYHRLAAEHRSTAGLLFSSRCNSGTILLTPYSMVWDWRVSMLFCWPKLLYPYYSLLFFFPFFLSIGWYCIPWVFGLIGCITLSLSLALPIFYNNNNNNNNEYLGWEL